MSAISNTSYALPPRRPWDPSRLGTHCNDLDDPDNVDHDNEWVEGKMVKGHPNICPLLDFFEDNHYYYLILPSTTPVQQPDQPPPSSDLFDLVESFPQGLPAGDIRSYLGQIADALCFLHMQGIGEVFDNQDTYIHTSNVSGTVHRDIKDENVVLGSAGRCILIDFGSSGLVKKHGWDTFSGTQVLINSIHVFP